MTYKRVKESVQKLIPVEPTQLRKIALITIIALILSIVSIFGGSAEHSTNIGSTTTIENIQDNKIGTLVLINTQKTPQFHQNPQYTSCIYSGNNTTPIQAPIEVEKNSLLQGEETKTVDLNLTIPNDKLDNISKQEYTLQERNNCPIRANQTIIVKEKQ